MNLMRMSPQIMLNKSSKQQCNIHNKLASKQWLKLSKLPKKKYNKAEMLYKTLQEINK